MNKPLLVDGRIPAFTPCPVKDQCGIDMKGECNHQGEKHESSYSCGMARAIEMVAQANEPPLSITDSVLEYKLHNFGRRGQKD
jgi:hypothetical protein